MATKKERIEIRLSPDIKRLAERAASVSGLSLTDYLAKLVTENTPKTLQHHDTITLSNQQFDDFIAYCEGEHEPSDRLRLAMSRLKNTEFTKPRMNIIFPEQADDEQ